MPLKVKSLIHFCFLVTKCELVVSCLPNTLLLCEVCISLGTGSGGVSLGSPRGREKLGVVGAMLGGVEEGGIAHGHDGRRDGN
jgi:hypothetical protein